MFPPMETRAPDTQMHQNTKQEVVVKLDCPTDINDRHDLLGCASITNMNTYTLGSNNTNVKFLEQLKLKSIHVD